MKRRSEREALRIAGAAAFVLTFQHTTGAENAAAFVRALPRIEHMVAKYTRPLIATVGISGKLQVREGERRGAVKKSP